MAKNKLSLVRETILPLSSDDLSQVAGGINLGTLSQKPPSGITQTVVSCGPLPQPTSGLTSRLTGGLSDGIGRQVSGRSNAF